MSEQTNDLTPTAITGIRTVSIPVEDQDAALAFYVDTLGFTKTMDAPTPNGRFIQLEVGACPVILTLEPATPDVTRGAIGIRFTTDDADRAHTSLAAAGVEVDEVLRWPGVPAMFGFRDPDGNTFSITKADPAKVWSDRVVDVWQREQSLARTTVGWGALSLAAGLAGATSADPWRRSFGLQTAGWGGVDLAIAVVGERLRHRRMRTHTDPYAAEVQEAERRKMFRILAVNAVADIGYVALGAVLARGARPRVAGAGSAIVVQGAFLLVHDTFHTIGARNRATVTL